MTKARATPMAMRDVDGDGEASAAEGKAIRDGEE